MGVSASFEERPVSILLFCSFYEVKKMDQPTNDLRQDLTRLEAAERKLETAERKVEAAELKREAQAFLK